MKKIILFALTLFSVCAIAQDAVITFAETEHDFGKIHEEDGRVTHVFEFKNEGMAPLTLTNVRASCGCTTPDWTKTPIEPGQIGVIKVTYNPQGRPGRFNKTVTITSNAKEPTVRIYIKGEVIPKQVKPVDQYPVKMGKLSLKSKDAKFGTIKRTESVGAPKEVAIEYANQTNEVVTVAAETSQNNEGLIGLVVTLAELQPSQTGQLIIRLNPANSNFWGPVATRVYLIVNGQKDENNFIDVKVNLEEDFSALTEDELKNAPILENLPERIELGTLKANSQFSKSLKVLKNGGNNPLKVRRIINTGKDITVSAGKGEIKGGKTGHIDVKIKTQEAGDYEREITILTNDPKQHSKKVIIAWTIK